MKSVAAIRSLHRRTCLLPIARVSTTTAGSAVRPQGPKGDGAVSREKQRREEQSIGTPPATDNVADNIPPFAPSPKLESHEVSRPGDPSFQQKRRWSNAAAPSRAPLVDVSCLGADGSPLAGGESDGAFGADVRRRGRRVQGVLQAAHAVASLGDQVRGHEETDKPGVGRRSGRRRGGDGVDCGGHGGRGATKSGGSVPGGQGEGGSRLAAFPGSREDASIARAWKRCLEG